MIMSKKVLILLGSPRKNGNSCALSDGFAQGARDAGHQVETVFLGEKKIGHCIACDACRQTGKCAIRDDMAELLQKMIDADVIVLASPVYFYSINGQLKDVIDRSYARGAELVDKEFYYILTAADTNAAALDCAEGCLHGYSICLTGAKEMGTLRATGLWQPGEAKDSPWLQKAYDMGRNV